MFSLLPVSWICDCSHTSHLWASQKWKTNSSLLLLTHKGLLWRSGWSEWHPTGTSRIFHTSKPLLSHIYMASGTGSVLWHGDVTLGDENKGWRIDHPNTTCKARGRQKCWKYLLIFSSPSYWSLFSMSVGQNLLSQIERAEEFHLNAHLTLCEQHRAAASGLLLWIIACGIQGVEKLEAR